MYIVYVHDESEGDFEKGYDYVEGDCTLVGTTGVGIVVHVGGESAYTEKRHYVAAFAYESHADRYRHYLSNHVEPSDYLAQGNLEPFPWNLDTNEPGFEWVGRRVSVYRTDAEGNPMKDVFVLCSGIVVAVGEQQELKIKVDDQFLEAIACLDDENDAHIMAETRSVRVIG